MARANLGRLLSSITNLSAPILTAPYALRSQSVLIRSVPNSASRLVSSSSTQQPQQQEVADQDSFYKKRSQEEGTLKADVENDEDEDADYVNKETGEIGGPRGPEPTRFGDWERNGRCSDF